MRKGQTRNVTFVLLKRFYVGAEICKEIEDDENPTSILRGHTGFFGRTK